MKSKNAAPNSSKARAAVCICRNQRQPVDGIVYTSPSCPVHYATRIAVSSDVAEIITDEEIAAWQPRACKRASHPKLAVAKNYTIH